jgi:branched-chain amino acid transport system substrate-binding protein
MTALMTRKWLPWLLALLLGSGIMLAWWLLKPAPLIRVGMVAWMASGAVVGSSEMHASDLFLEEHRQARLQVLPVDDEWDPAKTPSVIESAMAQGVQFFISTHPSKCAVASAYLFADKRALIINTASATPALSGQDDYFLRIIPDAVQEQRALARELAHWPGKRLLVLQDESNLPYTDPAFAIFADELKNISHWQLEHHKMMVSAFSPQQLRQRMAADYDAIYILAGTFQPAIGNIAQLFNREHPQAPILLTPWARSPTIIETAGDASERIVLASVYPSRQSDPVIASYFKRFRARFGYDPHAMTIGIRQALELLDQAFAAGYRTPEEVRHYLLSVPSHETSLGVVAFDRYGDVTGNYHFIRNIQQELQ